MNLRSLAPLWIFSLALACIGSMGCVGPMGCGPTGCGPVAVNQCGGCSDCDGCGELYVDPWINHPPQCGDPCDQCGNFNGQSCGKCRSVFDGVRSLWGYRCGDAGCDSGGCDGACGSCGPILPHGDCGGCGSCNACCDSAGGYLEDDHRTGCGCEVSCGCDGGCNGSCSSCGAGATYAAEDVADDNVATLYRPRRQRKIFTPRR